MCFPSGPLVPYLGQFHTRVLDSTVSSTLAHLLGGFVSVRRSVQKSKNSRVLMHQSFPRVFLSFSFFFFLSLSLFLFLSLSLSFSFFLSCQPISSFFTNVVSQPLNSYAINFQNQPINSFFTNCMSPALFLSLFSLFLFLSLLLDAEWKGPELGHVRGNTALL